MSIKWMATVWEDATDVEGTELLVLLSIADHADDQGKAFPSVGRLAQRARRAERTVQEALHGLEEKGWLERTPRSGRSTIYQIRTPAVDRTPADSAPLRHTAPDPRGGPHPSPAVDRTHNHQGTINEDDGGDVTYSGTEQQQQSNQAAVTGVVAPPGAEEPSVTRHVTPPFPWWAKSHHLLTGIDVATQVHWTKAWSTVCALEDTAYTPGEHLTRYLARMGETKKKPNPDEWVRWFIDDEQEAKRQMRIARDRARVEDAPGNPDWQ